MTDKLQCKECGSELAESQKFCRSCGASTEPQNNPAITDKLVCDKCGAELTLSLKFCGMCGASTQPPSDIKCPACGHENHPEFTFCGECGTSLTTEEEVLENETEDVAATVLDDEVDPNRSGEESSSDSERAVQVLDEAIRLNPQDAEAYNDRGFAYFRLGQYNQAIKDYDEAIRLEPQYSHAYYNRGRAYSGLDQYKQAIKDYDEAIRLEPQYSHAYYNRGQAYHMLTKHKTFDSRKQAIKDYDEAIRLEPQYKEVYLWRGFAYTRSSKNDLSKKKQAIKDFDEAIRLAPQHKEGYLLRAEAYSGLAQYKQAIKDADKFIELASQPAPEVWPNSDSIIHSFWVPHTEEMAPIDGALAHVYYQRGWLYNHLGIQGEVDQPSEMFERAIDSLDEAIRLSPERGFAYAQRGLAHGRLGHQERKDQDLEMAVRLDPGSKKEYTQLVTATPNLGTPSTSDADRDVIKTETEIVDMASEKGGEDAAVKVEIHNTVNNSGCGLRGCFNIVIWGLVILLFIFLFGDSCV